MGEFKNGGRDIGAGKSRELHEVIGAAIVARTGEPLERYTGGIVVREIAEADIPPPAQSLLAATPVHQAAEAVTAVTYTERLELAEHHGGLQGNGYESSIAGYVRQEVAPDVIAETRVTYHAEHLGDMFDFPVQRLIRRYECEPDARAAWDDNDWDLPVDPADRITQAGHQVEIGLLARSDYANIDPDETRVIIDALRRFPAPDA
jgi:hypothetical protein